MEEKKLVPKLRFPGFTEPWEQRKLGELADGVFGGGTPKTSIDTYWNGSIPWIQSSNLMDDKIENFINDKSITNLAIKESATKLIPANSIAIVTRVGVGKVALIREKFATSQDFLSFHCRHEHNPLFMSYQISRLMKVKSRLLQGTSIKGITKSEVLESEVLIPKGIEEENKIADFLSSCDNLITLHQRKLEHLKLKKKSLLQKLFPKEGEVYPEFRFPGFTDPWEQRKGDEIFISVSDKGYPQLPVLSASQELGMVYRDENGIDIHHNKSNEDTYKRVLPGQFVIHLRSFQGGFAYSNVEGITSPAYTVITFKNPELHYGLFWKQVFKSLTFIKHLETITYGIRDGRSISFSDFRSLKLCYPTYGEQKFIGDGLEKTDNLITLHQRKLEHLQLLKKALLQQLFV